MPLRSGYSKETISYNIRKEMQTRPKRQAIAIALSEARKSGGKIPKSKKKRKKIKY